jgi:hypothetical protein
MPGRHHEGTTSTQSNLARTVRHYRRLTLTPARMQFGSIPLAAMLLGDEAAIPLTSSSIEWRIGRPTERRMTNDN